MPQSITGGNLDKILSGMRKFLYEVDIARVIGSVFVRSTMTKACPYCFTSYDAGGNHLYECPALNERIKTIGKRGRLNQPLTALTHTGESRSHTCNCQNCVEFSEAQ